MPRRGGGGGNTSRSSRVASQLLIYASSCAATAKQPEGLPPSLSVHYGGGGLALPLPALLWLKPVLLPATTRRTGRRSLIGVWPPGLY